MKYKLKSLLLMLFSVLSMSSVNGQKPAVNPENFKNPPADYWPHTRWWWHGNAVTKESITRELE